MNQIKKLVIENSAIVPFLKKNTLPILVFFFFLIYFSLPTNNSTLDSWGFAAYVKQGNNLFLSHHLLYNATGFLWVKFIGLLITADTLKLLIILNAIFAASTLWVLGKTLRSLNIEGNRIISWVALAGSSWAMMRFATENETYIIPLFFSMLGSYYFIKCLKESTACSALYSGFFAALACLFHQVMFFWWISLLVGMAYRRKVKTFVFFALPAFVVPIVYILVLVIYYDQALSLGKLLQFVFRDYYSGAASVSAGFGSFAIFFISLFRSFFQAHGYIANLFHLSLLFLVSGLLAIFLLLLSFIRISQTRWDWIRIKEPVVWVHLLAIIFQLFFAFLSSGNAEFMVMIPLLLVIVLSQLIQNEAKFIGFLAGGMLIWNLSIGLVPLRIYDLDNCNSLSKKILENEKEDKRTLFVLFNKPKVENEAKYFTGKYPQNLISGNQYDNIFSVKSRIDEALSSGVSVLTDCINRPRTLSRESLILSNDFENLFSEYSYQKADSVETLMGKYYLVEISRK